MYEYVPGCANVCVNLSPPCSACEMGTPVIATVWASWSWFVHVTVAPVFTVIAAGLNVKLTMLTDVVATGLIATAGDEGAGDGVAAAGDEPPPQAETVSATHAAAAASSVR